jgi:hypothetical protein
MMPSRRGFLTGGSALALGGRAAQAQTSGRLAVTGARPTIFYAPLIACVTFLKKRGVDATFHWLGATPMLDGFRNGTVDVIQSAVSSYWTLADRGETAIPVHIAEINRRDGFFCCAGLKAPLLTGGSWRAKPLSPSWAASPLICCDTLFPTTKWTSPKCGWSMAARVLCSGLHSVPASGTLAISRARPPSR